MKQALHLLPRQVPHNRVFESLRWNRQQALGHGQKQWFGG
jgi:hypothetical protein